MELAGYDIREEIGDGGMATVFKGVQRSLERPVAIKVLKQYLSANEEIRHRFERESRIIARLNHSNIVHVIDQGMTAKGLPYFVMEYIKSVSLEAAIRRGTLETNRALDIFTQIAKGLAYAHKNRVIHCDIKPANILIDFEGTVKILDFGIALLQEDSSKNENDQKLVMGSESYMAPEQRQSASLASYKSDIYALGVIMYRFFAGRLPRDGNTDPAKINPGISTRISSLVSDCLARDAKRRPDSADEVKNRLLQLLQGEHLNADTHKRAQQDVKKSFTLLDVIKENKFGSVYVFEESTDRTMIVLKKKPVKSAGYETAKKLTEFKHSNVTNILGCTRNERIFVLVMEYCGGGSLDDRLTRPYELSEFYFIAVQILDALGQANDIGVLHGNLRPANILFTEHGVVKVSDFGLDEHYSENSEDNWYKLDDEPISTRADIYALGVIFHQMLTGLLPEFKHSKMVASKRFKKLPKEIQLLLAKMLLHDPVKRISNYFAVREYLFTMKDSEETVVRVKQEDRQLEQLENTAPKVKKRKAVFLLSLLLVLIGAILLLEFLFLFGYISL